MSIAPLRILYNEMNLLRTATLTPSSVLPAENTVLPTYVAKTGTGSVALTGAYTGAEDVTVDVQVLDLTADVSRASAPVLVGAGSGTMTDITADPGFAAQSLVFSLKDAGIPITSASVDFEGVKIVARNPGVDGNNIHINIDNGVDDSPPGMVYTTSNFSLLTALSSGQGSEASPLSGPEFDWNAQVLGADGQIPLTASRIAFGDDLTVYLQYKKYVSNDWQYFFVPALKRDIPIDTPIKIVTGGRTVTITDSTNSPATVETYVDIETVYDLLSALRETSALVTVDGIVSNDRSPTGQAARDLLVRTDAHADPSYGTGSTYAKGFEAIFVASDASTERVLARCYATNGNDHPLAHLGAERWRIFSSLSGELEADAITGVPYLTEKWGFTIPQRFPPAYGTERGAYSLVDVRYASRQTGEREPPICMALAPLGPAAVDQTVTLTYKLRPPADCDCISMPKPRFSLRCLGLTDVGGDSVEYTTEGLERLQALYDFASTLADTVTTYPLGWSGDGIPDTMSGPSEQLTETVSVSLPGTTFAGSGSLTVPDIGTTDYTDVALTGSRTQTTGAEVPIDTVANNTAFADVGFPADFIVLLDSFESAIQFIDQLNTGAPKAAGWSKWDEALTELDADTSAALSGSAVRLASMAFGKYQVMLRKALAYAGISPMGKSDASVLSSGDGCWQPYDDPAWFEVVGSAGGKYAPAFVNKPYYGSKSAAADGRYYSTHEFGFQTEIKCPQFLKEGDQIILAIGNAAWPATYQAGDNLVLPVIAAHDLYLAGGKDGDLTQTWNPVGSVDGPLAPYVLDPDAPTAYDSGTGLTLQINQGGIPYKNGDEFRLAIEGGHFQYRTNAGSWIGPLDIPDGPLLLFDGLSVIFTSGNAPSFAADDTFSFTVLQPRRASNLQAPGPEVWKWDDIGPFMQFDLGAVVVVPNFAVALHTLPVGCAITVQGSASLDSPWAPDWTEILTRVEGPIFAEFTGRTAQYLRLYVTDADGASIGWAFSGDPITTELSAELNPMSRDYSMKRGGLYQGGRYLGKAASGSVIWTKGALPEVDVNKLIALTDYSKLHGDQNFIIVPNNTRPTEAFMGHVATDRIDWPQLNGRTGNAGVERRYDEFQLPIAGVYFR